MASRELAPDRGGEAYAVAHSTLALLTIAFPAVVLLSLSATRLHAQSGDSISPVEPRSAAQALEGARRAQADFERLRRRNLPSNTTWSRGECNAAVGRMCWRYHPTVEWRSGPEPPAVREARDSLLRTLEVAAGVAAGDGWILGQRVRYLVEVGRLEEARAMAWQCGIAAHWWCQALEGLILHLQGRYPGAERAFEDALREMEPEEAGRWKDPVPLLDGDTRDLLEEATETGPGPGAVLTERVWQQADPLFLVPGNDRRTEHFARLTFSELFSTAATPHRLEWGEDMAELLLRYGWELGWERTQPRPGGAGGRHGCGGLREPRCPGLLPTGRDPPGSREPP